MVEFRALDPQFPVQQQMAVDAAPVVLINLFFVAAEEEPAFLRAWTEDAKVMKSQPGFISTQLHRAVGANATYLNYAVWETTAQFRAAFGNPEFQARLAAYPKSAVASPHLFQTVAVPGICVA